MKSILFKCYLQVPFHGTKKIQKNKPSGQRLKTIQSRADHLKEILKAKLIIEKLKQRIDTPIDRAIELKLSFYFPESVFYRSSRLPTLASLYELPQAALEASGVISNGALVQSHDGSRCLPICSNSHYISIEIYTVP